MAFKRKLIIILAFTAGLMPVVAMATAYIVTTTCPYGTISGYGNAPWSFFANGDTLEVPSIGCIVGPSSNTTTPTVTVNPSNTLGVTIDAGASLGGNQSGGDVSSAIYVDSGTLNLSINGGSVVNTPGSQSEGYTNPSITATGATVGISVYDGSVGGQIIGKVDMDSATSGYITLAGNGLTSDSIDNVAILGPVVLGGGSDGFSLIFGNGSETTTGTITGSITGYLGTSLYCGRTSGATTIKADVTLQDIVMNVSTISVGTGSTLTSGGDITGATNVNIASGGTLVMNNELATSGINNSGTLTSYAAINTELALLINSGTMNIYGSLTVPSINTMSGTLNVNSPSGVTVSNGISGDSTGILNVGNNTSAALSTPGSIASMSQINVITSGSSFTASGQVSSLGNQLYTAFNTTATFTGGVSGSASVNNAGTITVTTDNFNLSGSLTNTGTVNVQGVTYYLPGSIPTNTGIFNLNGSGAALSGNLVGTSSASQLNIGQASPTSVTMNGTISGIGQINVTNGSSFTTASGSGGAITNLNSQLSIPGSSSTATFNASVSGSGTLSNAGTITIAAGTDFNLTGNLISNTGTINVFGEYDLPGTITANTGFIYVDGNSALLTGNLSGGTGSQLFIGQNSIGAAIGCQNLTYTGAIGGGSLANFGSIFVGAEAPGQTNSTTFTSTGGIQNLTGGITIYAANTVTFSTNNVSGSGGVSNYGTLTIGSGVNFNLSGSFTSSNILDVYGALTLPATAELNGTVNVYQYGSITGGTTSITSTAALNNSGSVTVPSSYTWSLTGALTNNSTGVINVAGTYDIPSGITNSGTFNVYGVGATLYGNTGANPLTGATGAILNIGSDANNTLYTGTNYTTSSEINNIPTINVNATTTTPGFTIAYPVTGVLTFNNASGAITTLQVNLSGTGTSNSAINNSGTITFNDSSTGLSGFANLNMNSNAILNFSSPGASGFFDLSVPVTGATNSTNTYMYVNGTTTVNTSAAISNLNSIIIESSTTLETSSSIANIGTVTVDGSSSLTLLPNGSVSSFGTLNIIGSSNLTIDSGATFALYAGENITSTDGTGTIDNYGQLSLTDSTFAFNGSFTNENTGTFTIDGTNGPTFGGATFVNQGNIVANFSTSNTLPLITTDATAPNLEYGTIIIGYNNNYIAGGTYPILSAPDVPPTIPPTNLNTGIGILPQPSFYISNWSLVSSPTSVSVQVTRDGFNLHALTPSAVEVGAYLEELGASSSASEVLGLLNALEQITNDEELTLALESLLPPQYTMLPTLELLNATVGALDIRLASVQTGYGAGDGTISDVAGVWVRPFSANGKQETTPTLTGYSDQSHGWILGMDRTLNNNLTLGFAGSVSQTNVTQTDNAFTKTAINNYEVSFYGTYKLPNDAYIDGIIIGGISNYHGVRSILFPGFSATASANYSSQQFTAKIMASKSYATFDYWQLTPKVMAQYTFIRQLAYTESGAGPYDMYVDPDNINLFRLGAGTALGVPFATGNMLSIPSVLAMMYVDAKGGYDTVNCMFVSGGPVLNNIAQPGRIMIKLGAFYELKMGDSLQVVAGYDYFFRRGFQGHESYLNLRYTF